MVFGWYFAIGSSSVFHHFHPRDTSPPTTTTTAGANLQGVKNPPLKIIVERRSLDEIKEGGKSSYIKGRKGRRRRNKGERESTAEREIYFLLLLFFHPDGEGAARNRLPPPPPPAFDIVQCFPPILPTLN